MHALDGTNVIVANLERIELIWEGKSKHSTTNQKAGPLRIQNANFVGRLLWRPNPNCIQDNKTLAIQNTAGWIHFYAWGEEQHNNQLKCKWNKRNKSRVKTENEIQFEMKSCLVSTTFILDAKKVYNSTIIVPMYAVDAPWLQRSINWENDDLAKSLFSEKWVFRIFIKLKSEIENQFWLLLEISFRCSYIHTSRV